MAAGFVRSLPSHYEERQTTVEAEGQDIGKHGLGAVLGPRSIWRHKKRPVVITLELRKRHGFGHRI
jgi:hypothetical protein